MIAPSLCSSIHGSPGPCFSSHSARYLFSRCIPSLRNIASLTAGTFIIYSYKYQHDDGRVSYPLCFIFSSPAGKNRRPASFCTCAAFRWLTRLFLAGCKPEQQMMYAGSKNKLVQTAELSKVREFWLFSIIRIKISVIPGGLTRPRSHSWLQAVWFLTQRAETTSHSCFLQVFEIRNTEDLTEEWLREKLGFFG